ncbi:helix-turn-helix domain-containing protein [Serratia sp. UGAL515B_01]|uniref:helix-turn-helix domain-containing protein n=1 Tax=Serratia sp. UGAL515B_01 TaxID=2986763 RepID=UPI002953C89E|nr:helix-turn-helix domain-containing protein [Serratia sp. UGAL515B_01]WON77813.1 helix-turn-helix domain-containing protein [Serratia sp. UGAL515B_01]
MRNDNSEHKALFTIPEPKYGTALATTKPLPPQRVITGHKQTDAYLWVLEVIQLNEPSHLQAAEDALKKLKITPKQAQERYSAYLMKSGAQPFQIAFGTISLDNPQGYIDGAKRNIDKASKVRAMFGTYDAALDNTPPENLMLSGELNDVYGAYWGWTEKEIAEQCVWGERCNEINEQQKAISQGFVKQLPEPSTLSDVVREFQYWDWLYSMRNSAEKELGYEYAGGERSHITDREDYLETLLPKIKPVTRPEALEVCKWILEEDRFMDRGDFTNSILLNLVGECG